MNKAIAVETKPADSGNNLENSGSLWELIKRVLLVKKL